MKILVKKWVKDMHRHFPKDYIQIANNYIKRYLTSLVTREMEIKITVKHHFTLTKMVIKRKKNKISFGKDVEKLISLCIVGGNLKLCSHCGKWFDSSSKS